MRVYKEILSTGIKCLSPVDKCRDLREKIYLCYVFDCSNSWNHGGLYQGYGFRRPGVYKVGEWFRIDGRTYAVMEEESYWR